MTATQVRKFLQEDAPLTLHLVSGRKFHVPHTDFAALSLSQKLLFFTDAHDHIEVIRISSIESITLARKQAAA